MLPYIYLQYIYIAPKKYIYIYIYLHLALYMHAPKVKHGTWEWWCPRHTSLSSVLLQIVRFLFFCNISFLRWFTVPIFGGSLQAPVVQVPFLTCNDIFSSLNRITVCWIHTTRILSFTNYLAQKGVFICMGFSLYVKWLLVGNQWMFWGTKSWDCQYFTIVFFCDFRWFVLEISHDSRRCLFPVKISSLNMQGWPRRVCEPRVVSEVPEGQSIWHRFC